MVTKKKQFLLFFLIVITTIVCCTQKTNDKETAIANTSFIQPDSASIPNDAFGIMVYYGRELVLRTAYYIGPNGTAGHYTKNKMNCTNCHQEAGTKPYAFNLMLSHNKYPQYRPREGRVLTLADRVNNCVERPHSGTALPLDSKEMTAILSYLKWINSKANTADGVKGYDNLELPLLDRAASSDNGKLVYEKNCVRCHGENGEGKMLPNNNMYEYPPLWGENAYQPGSSMHRVIKQARWLKANMPHDIAKWYQPVLTDEECFDVAAFVNNDAIHPRPNPKTFDYPKIADKNIDYGKGPFIDTFSEAQHKYGPWPPIIKYWKEKGWKPNY
jgi:thiosulfate dehydrogenase